MLAIGNCTGRGGGDAGDAPGQRADAGADGAGDPAPGPPRRHHGQDLQHCRHTHSGPVSLNLNFCHLFFSGVIFHLGPEPHVAAFNSRLD